MSASSPPALVLASLAALVDSGPARFSLDEALRIRLRGPVVMAAAMGAGAAADANDPLSRSTERVGAAS